MAPALSSAPPPLLAANGDLLIEVLLAGLVAQRKPLLGFVQADRGAAFEMLVFAILHASTLADSVASRPSRGEPRGSSTCNDGR